MSEIRELKMCDDWGAVKALDFYVNGAREERVVVDEYGAYAGQLFVSEDSAGDVVGVVSISPAFWDRVFMIDHLAVLESHRRSGIAKRLVTHTISVAREMNARILCVQTATWNEGAIQFYESLGFTKAGVFPEYIGDSNDMVWLDIDLRGGD